MRLIVAVMALVPAIMAQGGLRSSPVSGLSCPSAGYMLPDPDNLCTVWFCASGGEPPIKRACPKGTRVPTWWEGGELNMCIHFNIPEQAGEPGCLRCSFNDPRPKDNCAHLTAPCAAGCTCVDVDYTHRCECPVTNGVLVQSAVVEFPRNYCEPNLCENGASCQNQWDGYFCFCPAGWTGHRCETRVCDWEPCKNGGTCVVDDIGFHCNCPPCFTGSCCNVTAPNCGPATEQPAIVCPPCFTGKDCKTQIKSCACLQNLCTDGALCVDSSTGPICQDCDKCFTGPSCKVKKDTCECNNNCPANSRCENLPNVQSHECICNNCSSGQNCDVPVVSCQCNNPCNAAQSCQMAGGKPICGCADSCKSGPYCNQTINSCVCNNPCRGGVCADTANGPQCSQCPACFTGPTCSEKVVSCECNNPCASGQVCEMQSGKPVCNCPPCMTGPTCSEKLMTCACNNPCQNGGKCTDTPSGPQCSGCNACFNGPTCSDKVTSCECNSPCSVDQVCRMENSKPVCGCPPCMTGPTCSQKVNTCECNNPCTKKDTCQNTASGAQCVCDCVGNEVCGKDAAGKSVCKCPECFYNLPGQTGCNTKVTNLCLCNNPCTGDQQVCVDSPSGSDPICKIGNPSSGNTFTVVFEENDTEKALRQVPLELYVTPSTPNSGSRKVNIRSAGLKPDHHCYFNVNLTIEANNVLRFPVERCMMQNKTGLENLAIRLTEVENNTMIVYGINKDRWTADGFLATPDVQAGKTFQTASYSPAHKGTQFAIVALYDDTEVEIKLADENDLPAPYNIKGAVYKLSMQAFQTFQVQARCPMIPNDKKSSCKKDLSGTVIKASKNVHVFSGNIRAFIPAGYAESRDHLVEELVPTDRWGTTFGLISIPTRVVGDVLNIMALDGVSTNVDLYYTDGSSAARKESFSLPQNGKLNILKDVPSGNRIFVKSDHPISVTQLTKSMDGYLYQNETMHDPASITVPPIQQFTNNFFFSTPLFTGGETFDPKPYKINFALLVAKAGDEVDITLDGKPLGNMVMPWAAMPSIPGGDSYVGGVLDIPPGTRLISNKGGKNFQCLIYGADDRESYGLPAAMNFAKIN